MPSKFTIKMSFKKVINALNVKKLFYKIYDKVQTTRFYRLLTSPEHKYIFYKIVYGYIYGIFVSYLFWDMIIQNLGFSDKINYIILSVMTVFLGLGCAFLTPIRCICFLVWVGFCGRAGRSVLKAVVMTYVISGPIQNIVENSGEVVRSFGCATVLTYNLSKTRFDMMTSPFHSALIGMKRNASHIKDSFVAVEEVIQPIVHEIEDDDPDSSEMDDDDSAETAEDVENDEPEKEEFVNDYNHTVRRRSSPSSNEQIQQNYLHKLESRCKLQIKKGEAKCKKAFRDAHDQCWERLPIVVNTLLCWPMKIDVICNIAGSLGIGNGKKGPCDPKNVVDPDMGKNYGHLLDTEEQLMANFSNVHVNYKRIESKEVPGLKSAQETSKEINEEFKRKKTTFDVCMFFVKKILSFFFFKIVITSYSYHKKYVSKIEHDNIYLTHYFKKIDMRRKERGQSHLLPLKKFERKDIIDPASARRLKVEVRGLAMHLVKLALEVITVSLFVVIDMLFYDILDLVRRHAVIDYRQEGRHEVNITVNGTGIIASMLRSAITGFNSELVINTTATNRPCLPRPNKLSRWYLVKIYGTFVLMLILLYNEVYVHRMKRILCSYFYPKREKRRTLYLYNKMLHRRKKLFKFMLENVKQKIKENSLKSNHNIFVRLRLGRPKYFAWLVFFKCARRHCLICGELEPRKRDITRPFDFMTCATPNCPFVHCEECWHDIGEVCLPCTRYNGNVSEAQDMSQFDKSD